MFTYLCYIFTNEYRRVLVNIDAFRACRSSEIELQFSDFVAHTRSGEVKTRMYGVNVSFTLDQYFWYRYWLYYFRCDTTTTTALGDDKITIGPVRLTSDTISYEGIQIKPFHTFIVDGSRIVLTGMYGWGGRINLGRCGNAILLAASIALDPAMYDVIY